MDQEQNKVAVLTPKTAPEIVFDKELGDYKSLIEKRSQLREARTKAYDALRDFIRPFVTNRVGVAFENAVDYIVVYKEIEDVTDEIKNLAKSHGYSIRNVLSTDKNAGYPLKELIGDEAFSTLQKAGAYYDAKNSPKKNEEATKEKKEDYFKLVKEYQTAKSDLEVVDLQIKDINEYVGFVSKVSDIARGGNK